MKSSARIDAAVSALIGDVQSYANPIGERIEQFPPMVAQSLYDWLTAMLSYQGVSDRVAIGSLREHINGWATVV